MRCSMHSQHGLRTSQECSVQRMVCRFSLSTMVRSGERSMGRPRITTSKPKLLVTTTTDSPSPVMANKHKGHHKMWVTEDDGERKVVCSCGATLQRHPGDKAMSPHKGI